MSVLMKQRDAPTYVDFCLTDQAGCGLDEQGRAWGWGYSTNGAQGLPGEIVYGPTMLPGDHRFVTLDCGSDHVCAVDESGQTWCWGDSRSP